MTSIRKRLTDSDTVWSGRPPEIENTAHRGRIVVLDDAYNYLYYCTMNFTWNSIKRRTNLKKHGFDFADAEQVFDGPTFTVDDDRDYDGEQRFNSTGFLGTAIVTICHTETEDEIHMISMRKAEPHEIDTLSHYL